MNKGDVFHNTFVVKKRLGQNFLIDKRMVNRIVSACDLKADETILEIGPGQGALTRELIPYVKRIIAVEADRQLIEKLKSDFDPDKLEVHHGDFLKFDLSQVPRPIKAVGNLPYYISSPIIARVIEERAVFSSLFMTVQLEFGERLVAQPRTKNYGALSVLVQFHAEPKLLFTIGNRSFKPVPKVTSCFIRMDLRKKPAADVKDEDFFGKVVRMAFSQRRKTLLNALSGLCTKDILSDVLSKAGISPQSRAEELGIQDFARLTNKLIDGKLQERE